MEEERLIDLSGERGALCVHYVFLPRLKSDLKCFLGSWNRHPIRTEGNFSPEQLWYIGMLQTPVAEPDVEVYLNSFAKHYTLLKVVLSKFPLKSYPVAL